MDSPRKNVRGVRRCAVDGSSSRGVKLKSAVGPKFQTWIKSQVNIDSYLKNLPVNITVNLFIWTSSASPWLWNKQRLLYNTHFILLHTCKIKFQFKNTHLNKQNVNKNCLSASFFLFAALWLKFLGSLVSIWCRSWHGRIVLLASTSLQVTHWQQRVWTNRQKPNFKLNNQSHISSASAHPKLGALSHFHFRY